MKLRRFLLIMLTATLAVGTTASADDGAITNKSMSQNIQLPDFGQDIVNSAVPEAEHAFTDMMGFYVPAQAASGLVGPVIYCDVDNQPASGEDCPAGSEIEILDVAKPLVNVFVYGPSFHVPNTAFAHRWFDTYAAVSLDDGKTWKKTNLSESTDRSSFNLETDHSPSGPGSGDALPGDHNIKLGNAFHAKGYETPYTAHCSECHGHGLQGVAEVPSCYSCHDNKWTEATPVEIGPIIYMAEMKGKKNNSKLKIKGANVADSVEVAIVNAITGHPVGTTETEDDGTFEFSEKFKGTRPPCVVYAEYSGNSGEAFTGPSLTVTNKQTGEPIENCEGAPISLMEYPGGTYNVFQATVGNKSLVAWPSRFCSSGQPAYSMTTDNADQAQMDRLGAVIGLIQNGDDELGVSALSGFSMDDDLYLIDAFGVAGNQGSIDFTEEGYPQAGVVPFGCVWTSRGVLLPGDDPRTADVTEESHMVWTKAERLTSGRRDPNRIEVKAVKGAGFVVTWQEDPEGLRPGQGEGPGEGWSGAVAHSQTDIWYSFINEEYFDIVETVDNPTVPIDILDHDLALSGRPQVFVPMAVPMRLSNNAKCNAPGTVTSGGGDEDLYCTEDASLYGLKDQCADIVTIQTGNVNSTYGLTNSEICVADSNGDGFADLPNRANTAATRPRTSLQGYSVSETDKSAWVIVAAEESKGLGKYFFTPDGLLSEDTPDYADPCDEEDNICTAEIGKNQWYYSFDMGTPDTSAGNGDPDSLISNLVSQGNMLNQPEVYWETGEFYGLMSTADMENYISDTGVDYNFDIVNTEIARRASLLVQSLGKATASANGLLAIPSWKQGTMRQGGPADTMLRRIVLDNTNSTLIPAEVPCAVQAKDAGDSNWGPWIEVSNAPEGCSGAIPDNCDDYTVSCTPIIVRDPLGPTITAAKVNANGRLRIEGVQADGDPETAVVIRNAVTRDRLGTRRDDDPDGNFLFRLNLNDDIDPLPPGAGNPYAFRNMVCVDYLILPGNNPYYPDGLCADSAINLSSVVPDVCVDDSGEDGDDTCPTVDFTTSTYGIGDTNPILKGIKDENGEALSNTQRVMNWHQCPSGGDQTSGTAAVVPCGPEEFNLLDQSWYNPLDISKGHRGFLDGDFVMFLYAWSPTWRLNAKGKDRYELYVRRSFDGGNSWTTTPSSGTASDGVPYFGDGTVTCESYRATESGSGEPSEPKACFQFAAGVPEHARNVTQHKSMRITTLDPRYAATRATIEEGCTDGLFLESSVIDGIFTCDDQSEDHDSDLRDASRYFMVFETGDNTTVEVGEAEPLDLNYSQAVNFGDDYVVWTELDTAQANPDACYPTVSYGVDVGDGLEGSGFCNEFDRMNTRGDTHSSEGDLEANPDGSKLYGVWTQWVFDETGEEISESDAMARRVWWLDNFIPVDSYTLPGTNSSSDN